MTELIKPSKYDIDKLQSPEEANILRAQIDAATKLLPQVVQDRQKRWKYAFDGNWSYIEASIKAGELWNNIEDKASPGGDRFSKHSQNFANAISSSAAGFKTSQDATMCSRLATMHSEDVRTYKDDCEDSDKLPSLGGLYMWWKKLNGIEDEDRPWLRVYQVWNFMRLDDRFGIGHPGNIPGQVNMNLNYYYTEPGDLIVDLFAGGGTTLDVCKWDDDDYGNRRCLAYDIDPKRPDIKKWDVVKDGLPEFDFAKMIFLDPPYWKQKRGAYSSEETNLANMPLRKFHDELYQIIVACLPRAEHVALIIGPTQQNWMFYDHAATMIEQVGVPEYRIQVPYSTQQHGGDYVRRAKEKKKWLYLSRDLLIYRGTMMKKSA